MFLLLIVTLAAAQPGRILLADVTVLTLREGQLTTARRVAAVQQLVCRGAYCSDSLRPEVVQCTNAGVNDRGSVDWRCEADLSQRLAFDELVVGCEGYEASDDPYILAGSCGLTYSLKSRTGMSSGATYGMTSSASGAGAVASIMLLVVCALVVAGVIGAACRAQTAVVVSSSGVPIVDVPPPSYAQSMGTAPIIVTQQQPRSDFASGLMVGSALSRPYRGGACSRPYSSWGGYGGDGGCRASSWGGGGGGFGGGRSANSFSGGTSRASGFATTSNR